jgi:hypothetical protein
MLDISLVNMNPWTFVRSQTGRDSNLKDQLMTTYFPGLKLPETTARRCQATGLVGIRIGSDHQIRAAHIVPISCPAPMAMAAGVPADEVDTPRNALLLGSNIERAFDKLQLSFVPSNPFDSATLVLKIWDDSIRKTDVFPGAGRTIGEFDGKPLDFPGQPLLKRATISPFIPCRRALWLHAYLARESAISSGWKHPDEPAVAPFGTPARESPFLSTLQALHSSTGVNLVAPFDSAREEPDEDTAAPVLSSLCHKCYHNKFHSLCQHQLCRTCCVSVAKGNCLARSHMHRH